MENTKKILDGLYRLKSDLKIIYLGRLKTRYDAQVETLDEAIHFIEESKEECKRYHEWGFCEGYEQGGEDAIKEFAEWLEKMNYLNEVEVDYDWEERPYESVYMLSKNEVINQYKEYKEQKNE